MQVALTRPQHTIIIVADLESLQVSSSDPNEIEDPQGSEVPNDDQELEREDLLTDPEEIRISTGYLKKVYDYYKAEASVVTLRKDDLPVHLVSSAEAKTFLATRTCRNCLEPGHRAKDCTKPRGLICRLCDRHGHQRDTCDDPDRKKQCRDCGAFRHIKQNCPSPRLPVCKKCSRRGHTVKDCPPICVYCRVEGHDIMKCPTLPEDKLICFFCGKEKDNAKDRPNKPPSKDNPADNSKAEDFDPIHNFNVTNDFDSADNSKAKGKVTDSAINFDPTSDVKGKDSESASDATDKTTGFVAGRQPANINWVNYAVGNSNQMEGNPLPAWLENFGGTPKDKAEESSPPDA
ncbi:MAG: hypothetical protein Q9209_004428 [Squamulea sp. 1 TL-2023]